jgi:hypothetical protein
MADKLSFEEWERVISEDPDDRDDRLAHGFTYDDYYQDTSLMCRNGCGLSYYEIVAGKMRECARGEVNTQAEAIARAFHEAYERLAPAHGYKTRKSSAKPWDEVPYSNKMLMIATVRDLLVSGAIRTGGE